MNIFWFRRDLRLTDNPAFAAAVKDDAVLPVYILDKREEFKIGGASQWWLHHSLESLNKSLDGKLNYFHGSAEEIIPRLAKAHEVKAVYWNKCWEQAFVKTDEAIEKVLGRSGIECRSHNGLLLWEPGSMLKGDGTPYKIFSPFLKLCLSKDPEQEQIALPKKRTLSPIKPDGSIELDKLGLMPGIKWYKGIEAQWQPGEDGAKDLLQDFVHHKLPRYESQRNFPAQDVLSRLSPHLHYGEISPLTMWEAINRQHAHGESVKKFISELYWREFACHLLYHFPDTATKSYSKQLSKLKWRYNKTLLKKWQQGQTGYPIVDAGMRQLWQTGYMHNRVRMITASFLIKNLFTDWRTGADWFLDCLVDADLAVNTMNWQWVAGTGLDASPFFRIFNPLLQSKKFDREGEYIRQYVPELSKLPVRYLHQPWAAPAKVMDAAGIRLGVDYPRPCVDLRESSDEALDAYQQTKKTS